MAPRLRSTDFGSAASDQKTSSGTDRTTGPGLPVVAIRKAASTTSSRAEGSFKVVCHLLMVENISSCFMAWDAFPLVRLCSHAREMSEMMANTGMEALYASARGETRLVAPGPTVASHTPVFSRDPCMGVCRKTGAPFVSHQHMGDFPSCFMIPS